MPSPKLAAALLIAPGLWLSGCSLDIVPVHFSRVNSAKFAEQPLLRGPTAPGAFKQAWKFDASKGYLFDPSEIEITDGVARVKGIPTSDGKKDATLVTRFGIQFAALDSFSDVPGPRNQGKIGYQLSHNGSAWYFHNGKKWVMAGPNFNQTNTPQEVSAQIGQFHSEVGVGELSVRAILHSPTGREPVELKEIQVQGIAPRTDGWD